MSNLNYVLVGKSGKEYRLFKGEKNDFRSGPFIGFVHRVIRDNGIVTDTSHHYLNKNGRWISWDECVLTGNSKQIFFEKEEDLLLAIQIMDTVPLGFGDFVDKLSIQKGRIQDEVSVLLGLLGVKRSARRYNVVRGQWGRIYWSGR